MNVSDNYEPLPHLVIQGSYSLEKLKDACFDDIFKKIFNNPLIVSSIDAANENVMKSYLLNGEKRLSMARQKFYFLKDGLQSLYPHIREHFFVTIHLKYDAQTLIRSMPTED